MLDNCQIENGKNQAQLGTPVAPIKSKGLEIADRMVNVDKGTKRLPLVNDVRHEWYW